MGPCGDASAEEHHCYPNPGQSHHCHGPAVACGWGRVGQEGAAPGCWQVVVERVEMVIEGYLIVTAFLCLHQAHPLCLGVAGVAG